MFVPQLRASRRCCLISSLCGLLLLAASPHVVRAADVPVIAAAANLQLAIAG